MFPTRIHRIERHVRAIQDAIEESESASSLNETAKGTPTEMKRELAALTRIRRINCTIIDVM